MTHPPVLQDWFHDRDGVVLQVVVDLHIPDTIILIGRLMHCLLEVGIKSQHLQEKRRLVTCLAVSHVDPIVVVFSTKATPCLTIVVVIKLEPAWAPHTIVTLWCEGLEMRSISAWYHYQQHHSRPPPPPVVKVCTSASDQNQTIHDYTYHLDIGVLLHVFRK